MAARSIEAGRAFMRLTINDQEFQKGIANVSKKMSALGKSISGFGAKFIGLGAGLGAPLVAAVKLAADSQETFSKFDTVFGDAAGSVRDFGNNLAREIGRSETEIGGFLASFQDLLVPIGIDPATATETSKLLTQLSFDMASFNNKADADVLTDLQAALTGSSEVMKKYGVIANETAVKQQLLSEGIDTKAATEQEKVFARIAIILKGTTAAQGDAIRTGDQLTNRLKGLAGAAKDFGVEVGRELLQPLANITGAVTETLGKLRQFASVNKGLSTALAVSAGGLVLFGGALVGIGLSLSLASVALSGFATVMGGIASVVALAVSPFGLLAIAVGASIAAFVKFTATGAALVDLLRAGFRDLLDIVGDTFALIVHRLQGGDILGAGKALFAGLKVIFLEGVSGILSTYAPLAEGLIDAWQTASSAVIKVFAVMQEAWSGAIFLMQDTWNSFSTSVQSKWAETQNAVTKGVLEAQKAITELVTGEEFDISVEVNQANANLAKTVNALREEYKQTREDIRDKLSADVADIASQRGIALDILANRGNALQEGLNEQLKNAKVAATDARKALAGMAAGAAGAAKEQEKAKGGLLENVQNAIDGIKTNLDANVSAEGTFRGATAALQFGPAATVATQQLAVAKQQLDKQAETVAAIKKQEKGLTVT